MAKQTKRVTPQVSEPEEEEQLSESYISIGLGLLVVIVVGLLLYNYFTSRNKTETPQENLTEEATTSAKPGSTYIVQSGDTLWTISEKSYGTGYSWNLIAQANNLSNSDELEAGMELKIPESTESATPAETPVATVETAPSPTTVAMAEASPIPVATVAPEASSAPIVTPPATTGATITGNSYTIAAGDTLWDIACRAYGDCYQWTKIAQANNLENPDLIFSGNTLTLPR